MEQQFVDMTGASAQTAKFFLKQAKDDLEKALDLYFEAGGADLQEGDLPPADDDDDDDEELDEAGPRGGGAQGGAGGPPGPSAPKSLDDLTNDIFEKAEKVDPNAAEAEREKRKKQPSAFSGKGFALGKNAEEDEVAQPQAPAKPVPGKPAPKTYKVTVWRGNAFQIDDGVVRFADEPRNKSFMEDLAKGHVPEELRERDEFGQPIPVNINLSDHREEDPSNAKVQKPKFKAFQGGGQTLGTDWTSEAYNKVANAAGAAGSSSAPQAVGSKPKVDKSELDSLKPDPSKPKTSIQVRLPGGSRVQADLNSDVSVATLRRWVVAAGHMAEGHNFQIIAGFPPKPMENELLSLTDAGLCNAAITIKPA